MSKEAEGFQALEIVKRLVAHINTKNIYDDYSVEQGGYCYTYTSWELEEILSDAKKLINEQQ